MTQPRLAAVDEKHVRLSGLSAFVVAGLQELPDILAQRDKPASAQRLSPDLITGNDEANEEWRRLIGPELRHLFVSAGETVARDLTGMERESCEPPSWGVTFATEHMDAWMSALNQARLILGELWSVTEQDMRQESLDPGNPKDHALLKIHLLGYLLQLFVERAEPGNPD